jgi:hypothetical protein
MPDDETYEIPEQVMGVDRRSFVKGSMAAASVGVVGAAGFGMFSQLSLPGDTVIRLVRYLGAKVQVGSPAPRGLPFIPVRANEEGFIEALPEHEGTNYLDWLRYCGYQSAPNLQPGFTQDNVLRYFLTEEKIHLAGDRARELWWYHDRLGQELRAEHFRSLPYGTGASVRWRSENVAASEVVTMLVLKLNPEDYDGAVRTQLETFMDMEHHLIGVSATCTHFCCVPGYKETQLAEQFNAWELIFCTCHNSRFDPLDITEYTFMLREKRGED